MANKAIFLDRDDTLIEDPGYINSPEQVKLLDGVAETLIEFKQMGYKLVIVSNQSAVARGIVTENVLGEIHNRLKQLLAEKGASLDAIYYCPYHPDGTVQKYRKESDMRKPKPGMLLAAAKDLDIDLKQSWAIGNNDSDIEAGSRAGCKTILINHPSRYKQSESNVSPDYKAVNIKEAVNIIKKYCRSPEKNLDKNPDTLKKNLKNNNTDNNKTEELLTGILEQLRSSRRDNMFGEFSITRLMAGIVQVFALFCLLLSIWFLMSPTMQINSVLISLGFTMVFQLMSLTFYVMQGQK